MKILIIEPSEVSRIVIEDQLMKLGVKSSDIHLCVDGKRAIEYVREEGVDILFTTLNLPGLDGVDFVDLILREQPDLVSRLFILSSSDKEVFDDVKEVGAKRFIRKPVNEQYFQHFVAPEIERMMAEI